MKRKLKLFLSMLILVFALIGSSNLGKQQMQKAASSDDCIRFVDDDVRQYMRNEKGLPITNCVLKKRVDIAGVTNLSQNRCNAYYNAKHDTSITGTCSIVASTEMVRYFGTFKEEYTILESNVDMFSRIYAECLSSKLTSINQGTEKKNVGHCLKKGFEIYGSTRSVASDWWNPQGDINNAVSDNVPIILDLTNHSVVVCGKATYTVTYKETYTEGFWWWERVEKTRDKIVDEEFAIVCEGWGRASRSLVYFPKITNYLSDGIQATWATGR